MIHTLTSAAHRAPEAPGSFLERPVRGIPDSEPRAPSVVSGARSTCAARAALDELPRCSLRSPNARTRSSYLHGSAPCHAAAASFGLDTPLSPLSCESRFSSFPFLKYVPSRARTRGVPRYFQPTSATQSLSLYLTAPVLWSLDRAPGSRRTPSRASSVHADGAAGAGPLDHRQGVRLPMSWRPSPPDVPLYDPSSRPPTSQPNGRGLEPLGPFPRTRRDAAPASLARDAFGRSRFERRFLAEGTAVPFRGRTARLESRSREKVTPPRRPKVSFRRCGLALMISAREVLPRS